MFEACYIQVNIHITHSKSSLLSVTEILHYTICLLLFTLVVVYIVCCCSLAALKRKLMLRRSVNELVDQGIYPRKYTLPSSVSFNPTPSFKGTGLPTTITTALMCPPPLPSTYFNKYQGIYSWKYSPVFLM